VKFPPAPVALGSASATSAKRTASALIVRS
jgi:hypothetical protein